LNARGPRQVRGLFVEPSNPRRRSMAQCEMRLIHDGQSGERRVDLGSGRCHHPCVSCACPVRHRTSAGLRHAGDEVLSGKPVGRSRRLFAGSSHGFAFAGRSFEVRSRPLAGLFRRAGRSTQAAFCTARSFSRLRASRAGSARAFAASASFPFRVNRRIFRCRERACE
jgi:hypothetical protein